MPGRLRDRMRQRFFYRVQGQGEQLNVFINSIKSAARVLRVDVSEAEVVRVISVSYTHLYLPIIVCQVH